MEKDTLGKGKTRYFSNLAINNLSSARALWKGDVLGKNREGHDIWRNVSEHCLVQTAGCDVLAQLLNLSSDSRKNLNLAAMAHDWDKKYQMTGLREIDKQATEGTISQDQAGRLKYKFFDSSEIHSTQGLSDQGFSFTVIQIASADGHPALKYINNHKQSTIEERIFHYVGSVTDGNNIVPLDQRIDNLETKLPYKSMNEYGRILAWTHGKTLYELQREVGHEIEQEIVSLLITSGNLDAAWSQNLQKNPKDLPKFLVSKIEEQYSK